MERDGGEDVYNWPIIPQAQLSWMRWQLEQEMRERGGLQGMGAPR